MKPPVREAMRTKLTADNCLPGTVLTAIDDLRTADDRVVLVKKNAKVMILERKVDIITILDTPSSITGVSEILEIVTGVFIKTTDGIRIQYRHWPSLVIDSEDQGKPLLCLFGLPGDRAEKEKG